MNIKNLYIAYTFQKDTFEWLNKKEMIYECGGYDKTPITIEFLNKSGEHYIERGYWRNGNILCEIPHENELKHGLEKWYYENGNISCITQYKNGEINE